MYEFGIDVRLMCIVLWLKKLMIDESVTIMLLYLLIFYLFQSFQGSQGRAYLFNSV